MRNTKSLIKLRLVALPATCSLLLLGIISPLLGQVAKQVAEANQLFREGKFDQAREKYLEALKQRPEVPELHFNLGDALYKSQQYKPALESFQQSLREASPELQANAWYNLGNALFRQGEFDQSLQAFKQSLKLNPDDLDAKRNLEFVLRQLQEPPPQEQKSEDQQNQDQEQNQDQDQQQEQQEQEQSQDQNQQDQDSKNQDSKDQEPGKPEQNDSEQQPPAEPNSEQQAASAPQEGEQRPDQQMSAEEVRRILDALKEDPEKFLKRRMVAPARIQVKKDW